MNHKVWKRLENQFVGDYFKVIVGETDGAIDSEILIRSLDSKLHMRVEVMQLRDLIQCLQGAHKQLRDEE